MNRRFTLRVYTLLEVFLVFIGTLILCFIMLGLLDSFLNSYLSQVRKFIALFIEGIFILSIFRALHKSKNWITTQLSIEMTDAGISFERGKSKLGLRKRNVFIHWSELNAWHLMEDGKYFLTHSLILKYQGNRKYFFYYDTTKDNQYVFSQFYKAFVRKIVKLNMEKGNMSSIKKISNAQMYRMFHTVVALTILSFDVYFISTVTIPLTFSDGFPYVFLILFIGFIGIFILKVAWSKDSDE